MTNKLSFLDVVALTEDLSDHQLRRGQVGTIVEILTDGDAFEVEFSDREGKVYASLGLRPEQLMQLHFDPSRN
jgi:hypothetical protein